MGYIVDKNDKFAYHKYMEAITVTDIAEVREKDISYGASWKKRGGIGAYMMLARKMDRLEELVKPSYDIFKKIEDDMTGKDGTVLAEIRDLRRYLLLVEAEMLWRHNDENSDREPT